METLWSKFFGKSKESQQIATMNNNENNNNPSEASNDMKRELLNATPSPVSPDPKVVEFFQDFPEPYRQKAVDRFSKREGLYKFDVFRDSAMQEEMAQAMRGIFLEDKREFQETQRQHEEMEWERQKAEALENFENREMPEWEKQVLRVIPLQPGETMGRKLFQTISLSTLGITFVWSWARFRKTKPSNPRFYGSMLGSFGLFGVFQSCALARALDWGPFDRSTDKRDVVTKAIEGLKSDFKLVNDYLEKRSRS